MAILCKQSKLQQNLGGPPLTSLHEAPDLVLCCEDGAEKKALLVEAEKRANEELSFFRDKGDRRGEAMMLLCGAEALLESRRLPEGRRGNKKRQEARAAAKRALDTFAELGDDVNEVNAHLVLAMASLALNDPGEALAFAEGGLALAKRGTDRRQEARALHVCAIAVSKGPTVKDALDKGLRYEQEALSIQRKLGTPKPLAWQCHYVAKWYLMIERPREAVAPAKESVHIFQELRTDSGALQECQHTLCKSMVGAADVKGALRIAREALDEVRARGDRRCEVLALETLVAVHLEADAFFESGDLQEARELSGQAYEICQRLEDKRWEATALHSSAQACLRLRLHEEALTKITESSTILDDMGEHAERATILQTALEILMAKGDGRAALEVAQEIRRTTKEIGKRSREANAMLMEAQIQHTLGQFDAAKRLAHEAQVIFQQIGDKKGEGLSWSVLSEVQKNMGEKADALKACRTTQTLYQQVGDKRSQAYAMKSSTTLFVAQSCDDEAVRSANEALTLARASGDTKAEVEMLNLVAQATLNSIIKRSQEMQDEDAIVHIMQREASAVRPAREAAALARKMGDKQMTGIATYSVAQCHAVAGRTGAAVQAATEARNLFAQTWDRQGEAMAILMLGESSVLDGDIPRGREFTKEASELFASINDFEGVEKAGRTLQQIEEIAVSQGAHVPSPEAKAPSQEAAGPSLVVAKQPQMTIDKARQLAMSCAAEAVGTEEAIAFDDGLMDIGLDSLAAIAFRETLSRESGLNLPSTLIFDYPNLSAVAAMMVESSAM
ncbi:pikAI [Symbiodinium natans]|uniref:PikAI protein n=1 Tax=Symbiodinium natans TaxID=878477 RepID=A0A812QIB5_9DINO|nr:pikAI [Symbiodinium natans]